jgi:hypothetical protein
MPTRPTRHLAHYLGLLHRSQNELARAFGEVGQGHADEPDVLHTCQRLAAQCDDHARQLEPFARRYSEEAPDEPERLHSQLFTGTRSGGLGLLRTRMKQAAPQALVVAT